MTTRSYQAQQQRRRIIEIVAGIGLIATSVLAVGLVYATFRGTFGNAVHVTAGITDAGDSLEPGDAVTFRDIIVGEVRSAGKSANGGAQVALTIQQQFARVIPANVLSIAVPVNLFGSTAVQLVPPPQPSAQTLREGTHIAADTSPGAAGLQSALTDAYQLLTAIRPADLDAALTALADALQGQGANVGELIEKADAYLRRLTPSIPTLESALHNLATVSEQLAAHAPDLLSSVQNLLGGARTIITRQSAITALLAVAPQTVNDASALLDNTSHSYLTVVNAQQAVLAAFRDHPDALPKTLSGFKAFADTFGATLSSGPYAQVNVLATGPNNAALGPLLLGQPTQVLAGVTNPQVYTVAQCPRYQGASGPNCPTSATAQQVLAQSAMFTTSGNYGGSVGPIGTRAEIAAIEELLGSASGTPSSGVPAADDLIVGPLLRGTATVIW